MQNHWLWVLANFRADFALAGFSHYISKDIWPPHILCKGQNSNTSGVCGVDILQHSVFNSFRLYCPLINAQAAIFNTHIPPVWVDVWANFLQPFFIIANDATSLLFQDGSHINLPTLFLLLILLIVSVIFRSLLVFVTLVEGAVSVIGEVFVAGEVLEREMSEKVTRTLVGVDLVALVLGILEM